MLGNIIDVENSEGNYIKQLEILQAYNADYLNAYEDMNLTIDKFNKMTADFNYILKGYDHFKNVGINKASKKLFDPHDKIFKHLNINLHITDENQKIDIIQLGILSDWGRAFVRVVSEVVQKIGTALYQLSKVVKQKLRALNILYERLGGIKFSASVANTTKIKTGMEKTHLEKYNNGMSIVSKFITPDKLKSNDVLKEVKKQASSEEPKCDKNALLSIWDTAVKGKERELLVLGYAPSNESDLNKVDAYYDQFIKKDVSVKSLNWTPDTMRSLITQHKELLKSLEINTKAADEIKAALDSLTNMVSTSLSSDKKDPSELQKIFNTGKQVLQNMNRVAFAFMNKTNKETNLVLFVGNALLKCKE